MIVNSATYTSISNNLVSMRLNTIAIRRTLLNNRKTSEIVQKKTEKEEARISETKARRLVQEKNESNTFEQMLSNIKLPNWRLNLRNPLSGFSVPGLGILGGAASFLGFGLLGWMLNALPSIVKAVKDFMERAKKFLETLTFFWNTVKIFFDTTFTAIENFIVKMGFGGAGSLGEGDDEKAKKQLDTLAGTLKQFIAEFPQKIKELVSGIIAARDGKQPPSSDGQGGPMGSAYGIDVKRLATATGAAEGNYGSVGVFTYAGMGHGLGRYQFMTGRSDVQKILRENGKAKGISETRVNDLIKKANYGPNSKEAAKQLLDLFPPQSQDALFRTHTVNTLTQIKRKYPNASTEFLVKRFAAAHLSGDFEDVTSADVHGTTGAMHGEKIWKAYQKTPASPDANQPILAPSSVARPETPTSPEQLGPSRTVLNQTIEVPIPPEVLNRVRQAQGPSESYFNSALQTNILQVDGDNVTEGLF